MRAQPLASGKPMSENKTSQPASGLRASASVTVVADSTEWPNCSSRNTSRQRLSSWSSTTNDVSPESVVSSKLEVRWLLGYPARDARRSNEEVEGQRGAD